MKPCKNKKERKKTNVRGGETNALRGDSKMAHLCRQIYFWCIPVKRIQRERKRSNRLVMCRRCFARKIRSHLLVGILELFFFFPFLFLSLFFSSLAMLSFHFRRGYRCILEDRERNLRYDVPFPASPNITDEERSWPNVRVSSILSFG